MRNRWLTLASVWFSMLPSIKIKTIAVFSADMADFKSFCQSLLGQNPRKERLCRVEAVRSS